VLRLEIISDFSYEKDTRRVLNGEPWQLDKSIIVTLSNVHGIHTSTGWLKQDLEVLAAMPIVEGIGSTNLCG